MMRHTWDQYAPGDREEWEESENEDETRINWTVDNTWGDPLSEEKAENVTRIYFQNLNGVKWDKEGGNWPAICQAMADIHVDIMGFAEVN